MMIYVVCAMLLNDMDCLYTNCGWGLK